MLTNGELGEVPEGGVEDLTGETDGAGVPAAAAAVSFGASLGATFGESQSQDGSIGNEDDDEADEEDCSSGDEFYPKKDVWKGKAYTAMPEGLTEKQQVEHQMGNIMPLTTAERVMLGYGIFRTAQQAKRLVARANGLDMKDKGKEISDELTACQQAKM